MIRSVHLQLLLIRGVSGEELYSTPFIGVLPYRQSAVYRGFAGTGSMSFPAREGFGPGETGGCLFAFDRGLLGTDVGSPSRSAFH